MNIMLQFFVAGYGNWTLESGILEIWLLFMLKRNMNLINANNISIRRLNLQVVF